LDAGDGMVILECRAAVTDGTWRLKGIFQGRLMQGMAAHAAQTPGRWLGRPARPGEKSSLGVAAL
ncbi:hypothetical protein, partial [Xanthomonas fragariae]|uniref:hypothetical protein n=1 Tax=Xanthomonas fragariae TaxID=48664 RepID=UPI001ADB50D4